MKNIYARGVSPLLARRTLEHRPKKVLDFRASDLVQRNFERRNTDGMDVIGMNPRPRRRIFRHNLFSWSPLCTFIEIFAPEEAKPCRNWRSNNGDGLDAVQSGRANRLQEVIAAASKNAYARCGTSRTMTGSLMLSPKGCPRSLLSCAVAAALRFGDAVCHF